MSKSEPSEYIHGTAAEEQARLSRLNTRLNAACLPRLDIQPGMRVLEVGSGLGQMSVEIAAATGSKGSVLGIERDPVHINEARALARTRGADALEIREGDALDLPLSDGETGSFDLVYCRFVLEHLPNPLDAVKEMFRAVKPGGRIALADDDHGQWHMHPPCPEFDPCWAAYMRSYNVLGCDARVGSHLPELLARAGATPSLVDTIFFGGCNGEPRWHDLVTNMVEVVRTGRDLIARHALMDTQAFDRGLDAVDPWSKLPGASIWYPVCWAEGVKPTGAAT